MQNTSHRLVELTGDSLPTIQEVKEADIIITTPESLMVFLVIGKQENLFNKYLW